MFVMAQRINDIYKNCNEVIDFLNTINQSNDKEERAYNIHCISECIDTIKTLTEYIELSVEEKDDRIHILQKNLQQLELDFEEDFD